MLKILALLSFLPISVAYASFYSGQGQPSSLEVMVESIPNGAVLVIGEVHGQAPVQDQQMQILQALRDRGLKVHVAMEFFNWPFQELVNQYRLGNLSEPDFLQQIGWGKGFSFDYYRSQALWPRSSQGEQCLAINAPSSLTRKVSRMGLASLTDEDKALLPPQFQLGNQSYFERFKLAIGHGTPEQMENYFAAQSIWDDTMAFRAVQTPASDAVTVIIVGEFHVQYGGGLPDRLRQRTNRPVVTLSQVDSSQEPSGYLPDHKYGPRADYIWMVDIPQSEE